MKSKEEKVLELKLKINDLSLAIQKLKKWNDWNIGDDEKRDLNKERMALLEESKRLFLNRLKELEGEEEEKRK